jgi:hypothetical protein
MSSTTIVKPAELGFGIACVTFFLSVMANIRLWYGLGPQPGPLTQAVMGASSEQTSAILIVAVVAVYGLFMLLGFIVSAVLLGLAAAVGRLVSVPEMLTGGLLAAGLVTRHFRELPTGTAAGRARH